MSVPDDPLLQAAAGSVRDAIAALQNLYSLLRSSKVGPKAIEAILPEIRESCVPVSAAVLTLLEGVRGRLPERAPIDALGAFVETRSAEIVAALVRAEKSVLDARARLGLEAEVTTLAPALDAARALVDLVYAAAVETPVETDLAVLLDEAFAPTSQRGVSWAKSAPVTVDLPPRGKALVEVRPNVATALVNAAIGLVVHREGGKMAGAHIAVGSSRAGAFVDVDGRISGRGDALILRPTMPIEPTAAVLRLAASACQIELVLEPPSAHARVEFVRPAD